MTVSMAASTTAWTGGAVNMVSPTAMTARTSTVYGARPSGTRAPPSDLYCALLIRMQSPLPSSSQLSSACWALDGHSQDTFAYVANGVTTRWRTGSVTATMAARPTTIPVPPMEDGTRGGVAGGGGGLRT